MDISKILRPVLGAWQTSWTATIEKSNARIAVSLLLELSSTATNKFQPFVMSKNLIKPKCTTTNCKSSSSSVYQDSPDTTITTDRVSLKGTGKESGSVQQNESFQSFVMLKKLIKVERKTTNWKDYVILNTGTS